MFDPANREGVYAEVFVAAMESACFFERDLEKLVEIGLSYIPEDCAVARAVRHGAACARAGMGREDARRVMLDNWIGHIEWHYISPEDEAAGYKEGKMGWDVPSNMFITVYAMLACAGDFDQSICTAVYFGEDTDCTAGTIAAMYGLMYGVDCIDEKWITPIGRGIKTVSLDPFRLYGRIPATIDEMSERVEKLFVKAVEHFHLDIQFEAEGAGEVPDFHARDYFRNLYDDLNVVRYAFPYLTVRLDYCGEPVLQPGVPKKLRLVTSDSDEYVAGDRVQVLVMHTHGTESYTPSPGHTYTATGEYRTTDSSANMLRVGQEICDLLNERGISTVHSTVLNDYPAYSGSYNRALKDIQAYVKRYPSIQLVIDVHRDAIASGGVYYKTVAEVDGVQTAQLMFVTGTDAGGLAHSSWRSNLTFQAQLHDRLNSRYPGIMRPMSIRASRFNQHVRVGSMLLEVGACGNTLDEALAAARLFADTLADTLLEP